MLGVLLQAKAHFWGGKPNFLRAGSLTNIISEGLLSNKPPQTPLKGPSVATPASGVGYISDPVMEMRKLMDTQETNIDRSVLTGASGRLGGRQDDSAQAEQFEEGGGLLVELTQLSLRPRQVYTAETQRQQQVTGDEHETGPEFGDKLRKVPTVKSSTRPRDSQV